MIELKNYAFANNILKFGLSILAIGFLVYQVFFQHDFEKQFLNLSLHFSNQWFFSLLISSILLMPANWLLEAIKWRYLIHENEEISLKTSIRAVLAGLSISSISPNRVGEFFGRLFVLKKTKFWQGVFVTFIGSLAQTLTTLSIGLTSLLYFYFNCRKCFESFPFSISWFIVILWISAIGIVLSFTIYFRIRWFLKLIPSSWQKIRKYSEILNSFSFKKLFYTFAFSLMRYSVFSFQFVILLWALNVPIGLSHGLLLVSIIFLLNTISPSIALLELGIRGSITLFVFSTYFSIYQTQVFNFELEVLLASSLIWLINILAPSALGLFFISDLSFFKSNKNK